MNSLPASPLPMTVQWSLSSGPAAMDTPPLALLLPSLGSRFRWKWVRYPLLGGLSATGIWVSESRKKLNGSLDAMFSMARALDLSPLTLLIATLTITSFSPSVSLGFTLFTWVKLLHKLSLLFIKSGGFVDSPPLFSSWFTSCFLAADPGTDEPSGLAAADVPAAAAAVAVPSCPAGPVVAVGTAAAAVVAGTASPLPGWLAPG